MAQYVARMNVLNRNKKISEHRLVLNEISASPGTSSRAVLKFPFVIVECNPSATIDCQMDVNQQQVNLSSS
jgi:hypothetical protein